MAKFYVSKLITLSLWMASLSATFIKVQSPSPIPLLCDVGLSISKLLPVEHVQCLGLRCYAHSDEAHTFYSHIFLECLDLTQTFVLVEISSVQSLSCVRLCDPMDCSTPGFPVHHHSLSLLKLMPIELVMTSNHLILCHPLLLPPSIFPSIRVFPMNQLFTSGCQSARVPASASVLLMNIQNSFPL